MSDPPESRPAPRNPVIVPPAAPRKPAAAPPGLRIMASGGPPPVPSSIIRALLSTRGWAVLCSFGLLLTGLLLMFKASRDWREAGQYARLTEEPGMDWPVKLLYADAAVGFAVAAACLLVVPRLFRYAAAVTRLRAASRMAELENALRHQRAVWLALGAGGALWLLSFAVQILAGLAFQSESQEVDEQSGELENG